jgi:hypothetical protein
MAKKRPYWLNQKNYEFLDEFNIEDWANLFSRNRRLKSQDNNSRHFVRLWEESVESGYQVFESLRWGHEHEALEWVTPEDLGLFYSPLLSHDWADIRDIAANHKDSRAYLTVDLSAPKESLRYLFEKWLAQHYEASLPTKEARITWDKVQAAGYTPAKWIANRIVQVKDVDIWLNYMTKPSPRDEMITNEDIYNWVFPGFCDDQPPRVISVARKLYEEADRAMDTWMQYVRLERLSSITESDKSQ